MQVHFQGGQVNFVYQGHPVKVKVTGAKTRVVCLRLKAILFNQSMKFNERKKSFTGHGDGGLKQPLIHALIIVIGVVTSVPAR